MKRKKKRWLTPERSQVIGFILVFVAIGFVGGVEMGNLPLGGGIILSVLTFLLAWIVFILGGNE